MSKWGVYGTVQGGKYLGQVDAETAEEAVSKGWDMKQCFVSLCHHCSHHCEDPEIIELKVELEGD